MPSPALAQYLQDIEPARHLILCHNCHIINMQAKRAAKRQPSCNARLSVRCCVIFWAIRVQCKPFLFLLKQQPSGLGSLLQVSCSLK